MVGGATSGGLPAIAPLTVKRQKYGTIPGAGDDSGHCAVASRTVKGPGKPLAEPLR